ncbi:MAG: 2-C-methyl-D-erythritol 4-phosphate cytidylyltransferase [Lachnospiraceae bacterium]|nr:2-C-methyl-D-erythritol 4-phosphate cytidylyltransferase [Lachnospiraceae bacterium]
MKCAAIVLAAGRGKRMGTDTAKQYLMLNGYPVLYYSLKVFQESFTDEIILVTSETDREYCSREFVKRYEFDKVVSIVSGGKERYHSVWAGLQAVSADCGYVFIHDAARPCLTEQILDRAYETEKMYGSAVAAMPVKDTIKTADASGFVTGTPARDSLYLIQTPQVFRCTDIKEAYARLFSEEALLLSEGIFVTDDAMVMERFGSVPVRLFEGSYQNIKITTKDDLAAAEIYTRWNG